MRTCMWPAIALVLFIAAGTEAQETGGALDGTVTEADGSPIPGAVVTVESPAGSAILAETTDASGYFRLAGLPVGTVAAVITYAGHPDVQLPEIAIRLGRTTSLGTIQLTGQTYELPALVVTGLSVPIDAYSASVGDDLLRGEFEDLPLDRNYRSLASLLPEVNVSYFGDEASFSGGTGLDNRYFIDGMDVTDPFRGVSGTNLPYNFIKAVEVRSNGYEAEYRSSLGGILNVVTLDGSDELQGSVFGFFANNRLAGLRKNR